MGFWKRLLSSSPVNNAFGNNFAFPGVRSSRDVTDEDFSQEYASELYTDTGVMDSNSSYSDNGVFFKEATNVFRLTYDGILARDGARDVYAVVGTEDYGSWKDIKYYPMQKTDGQGFEVLFPATGKENVNVAFKDGADHWDNNSGRNYMYVKEGG